VIISKTELQARRWLARRRGSWLAEIVAEIDTVFVLALRSQREAGYTRT
jgi:hypothetical protein